MKTIRGPAAIIIACLLWAYDYTFLRGSLYAFDPSLIIAAEHIFGTIVMLGTLAVWAMLSRDSGVWRAFNKLWLLNAKEWFALLAIAVFVGVVATLALTKALFLMQFDALALPAVMQKLQPIFAIAGAFLLLGERMPKRFWMWVLVALVGSVIATLGFRPPTMNLEQSVAMQAALLGTIAAMGWGLQTVFARMLSDKLDFHVIAFMRLFLTAILAVVLLGVEDSVGVPFITSAVEGMPMLQQLIPMLQESGNFYVFLKIAGLSGVVAMFFYYIGIRRVKASMATIYELALPVALEVMVLRTAYAENFDVGQWMGVGLVTIAILMIRASAGRADNSGEVTKEKIQETVEKEKVREEDTDSPAEEDLAE